MPDDPKQQPLERQGAPNAHSDQSAHSTARVPEAATTLRNRAMIGFLGFSALFVFAEALILARRGELGLIVHGGGLLLLFVVLYRSTTPVVLLYQSLVLIPVLRIFNLGFPLFTENSLLILSMVYAFLLVSVIQVSRSQGLTIGQIGLAVGQLPSAVFGAGAGVVLGAAQYGLALESLTYQPTLANYGLVVLTTGVLIGLVEELIFRGLVQRRAAEILNTRVAIVVTSVVFGFMHSVWLTPLDIVFAGTVSLIIGWVYAETNNMWLIAGIHGMINVTAFLLLPVVFPEFHGQLAKVLANMPP